jgi:hypothetical protein
MFVFIVLKVATQITFITSLHGGEFNAISMDEMFVLRLRGFPRVGSTSSQVN